MISQPFQNPTKERNIPENEKNVIKRLTYFIRPHLQVERTIFWIQLNQIMRQDLFSLIIVVLLIALTQGITISHHSEVHEVDLTSSSATNVTVRLTALAGLSGGQLSQFKISQSNIQDFDLNGVQAYSGQNLVSIKFLFSNPAQSRWEQSPKFGGDGGNREKFTIQPGDKINKIELYRRATALAGLKFFTERNQSFSVGRFDQFHYAFTFAHNERTVGAKISSGDLINQIGLFIATDYVSTHEVDFVTPMAGGSGGKSIDYQLPDTQSQPYKKIMDLTKIQGYCGDFVDGLAFVFSNTNQSMLRPAPGIGQKGGTLNIFSLEKGDKITSMDIFYDNWVNGIKINTRNGISWICGKPIPANKNFRLTINENQRIIGFNAKAGFFLDSISLRTSRDIMRSSTASPSAMKTQFKDTQMTGYEGGGQIMKQFTVSQSSRKDMDLISVQIFYEQRINSIKFIFINSAQTIREQSLFFGENKGNTKWLVLQGDKINKIEVYGGGEAIDGLKFFTERNISYSFGRFNTLLNTFKFAHNERIIGVKAISGSLLYKIGFIVATNYTFEQVQFQSQEVDFSTPMAGGSVGKSIDFQLPDTQSEPYKQSMNLVQIKGQCGKFVDGLAFVFSDTNQIKFKTAPNIANIGGTGGSLNIFSLEKGDKITSMDIYYDNWVNGIQIQTKSGRYWSCGYNRQMNLFYKSPIDHIKFDIKDYQRIIGFNARGESLVNSISLRIAEDRIKSSPPTSSSPMHTYFKETRMVGHNGGQLKQFKISLQQLALIRVKGCFEQHINQISFQFRNSDRTQMQNSPSYGQRSSTCNWKEIWIDSKINKIEVYGTSQLVDGLKFFTESNLSYLFGRSNSLLNTFTFAHNERIVGVNIMAGVLIDKIGFIVVIDI